MKLRLRAVTSEFRESHPEVCFLVGGPGGLEGPKTVILEQWTPNERAIKLGGYHIGDERFGSWQPIEWYEA